jgi:hypothetical protein
MRSDENRKGNVTHRSGLVIRKARESRARPVRWLWEGRVLLGYLNLLIGEEGIGKGTLIAWIAARVTRGDMPGALTSKAARVAIIGDEDSYDHIWVPRLKAAGANLRLVEQIAAGPTGTLDIKADAAAIRDYIEDKGVALVYFDQLLDNLGLVDTWKDKQVRDAIAPIRLVAQETDSAMLAAMHPNKRAGSFRDRISGTPAFNALSRSSLLVARHPYKPSRVVVVRGKGNFGVDPLAFEFEIEGRALRIKDGDETHVIETSRIAEIAETAISRDDVLAASGSSGGIGERVESDAVRARRLLLELLEDGDERPASGVLREMKEKHGLADRKVRTAASAIGVVKRKVGYQGLTYWRLPTARRGGS